MTSLAIRNEHLAVHRRMIVVRSLATAVAGMTPIPLLDDWLVTRLRRGTIQRIAAVRGVDLDEDALRAIAEGSVKPPGWQTLVNSMPLSKFLRRGARYALRGYFFYVRADAASRDFAVATLFDHYCARIHVGGGLDAAAGRALRARIDRALAKTPSGPLRQTFRAALGGAGRALVRAPFELADVLSGGRLRARLRARAPIETKVEEVPETEIEEALVEQGGSLLDRVGKSVDRGMMNLPGEYVADLVARFEEDRG
jgi:hypothetical protein